MILANDYKARSRQLQAKWLQEIMTSVFVAETGTRKKRNALHFVDVWKELNVPAIKNEAVLNLLKELRNANTEEILKTISIQLKRGE